ncbi:MAG: GIY-YIG nuclease family protein, partial [bacterium]
MAINNKLKNYLEERMRFIKENKRVRIKQFYTGAVVYKITNINNDKVYIGACDDFYKRSREHIMSLFNNYHFKKEIQDDFNNGDNFKIEIILKIINNEIKQKKFLEDYYIDYYSQIKEVY